MQDTRGKTSSKFPKSLMLRAEEEAREGEGEGEEQEEEQEEGME